MIVKTIAVKDYELSIHLVININWKLWTKIKKFSRLMKKIIKIRAKNLDFPK